jgi:hypothetical protein
MCWHVCTYTNKGHTTIRTPVFVFIRRGIYLNSLKNKFKSLCSLWNCWWKYKNRCANSGVSFVCVCTYMSTHISTVKMSAICKCETIALKIFISNFKRMVRFWNNLIFATRGISFRTMWFLMIPIQILNNYGLYHLTINSCLLQTVFLFGNGEL